MRVTRLAAAAAVVFTTFACSAGERSLAPNATTNRVPRVGHSKPLSALRLPKGISASLAAPTNGIAVQDMTDGITAQALAQALVGPGVTISNVTYTGAQGAAGIFSADTTVLGLGSGIVLSTGSAKAVIGPNQFNDVSTDWGGAGDAQLSSLVGNNTTADASILQFDVVPDSSTLYIAGYVFGSDEYNEFVNSDFNDAMAFYVNGTNCALVGSLPVSINAINNGFPYNSDPRSNPDLYRNNSLTDGGGQINTELDGVTRVLTCVAAVNKGQTNHIKLAIADVYDGLFDSDVFIGGGTLTTIPPKPIPVPHAVATFTIGTPDCTTGNAVVALDGSGSYDALGSAVHQTAITNYAWSIYSSGQVGTGAHFNLTYSAGSMPSSLTVTDSSGKTATTYFTVVVPALPSSSYAFSASPTSLPQANGQYSKMTVTATATGRCAGTPSVVVSSSQTDLGSGATDQAGDIRVVHHDGSVAVSSVSQPTVTFDPAQDTLYLRAETLDSTTDRTYTLVMSTLGVARGTAKVVVPHPLPAHTSQFVIWANSALRMNGNTSTDGYNAALGAYHRSSHDSTGSVASIQTIVFDGKNPRVDGDAVSGGSIPSGSYVTGTRTEHASLQAMPVVACPAGPYTPASAIGGSKYKYKASTGDLSVSGQGSIVLNGAGPFYFSSLSVDGQATVSVSSSQHVDIYVSDDFSANGNAIANGAYLPSGISIIACGSPKKPSTWQITGNAMAYFVLYAPNHDVQVAGNGQLFGCLVGDDVTLDGNGQVHLDESLGGRCGSYTSTSPNGNTAGGGGSGSGGNCAKGDDDHGKKNGDKNSCSGGDDNHGNGNGDDGHGKGDDDQGGHGHGGDNDGGSGSHGHGHG